VGGGRGWGKPLGGRMAGGPGGGEGGAVAAEGLAALQRRRFAGDRAGERALRAREGHHPGGLPDRASAGVRARRWEAGSALAPPGAAGEWGAEVDRAGSAVRAGRVGSAPPPAAGQAPPRVPSPAPLPGAVSGRGRFKVPGAQTPAPDATGAAKRPAAEGSPLEWRPGARRKWETPRERAGAVPDEEAAPAAPRGFRSAAEALGVASRSPGPPDGVGPSNGRIPSGRSKFQLPVRRDGTAGAQGGRGGPVGRALPGSAGGGGGGKAGGGGDDGDEKHPGGFSDRVMALLGDAEGKIPEAVEKLDPQIVDAVCNDVMEQPNLKWDEIVGQEEAKRLIREMVVWPVLNPGLFSGKRTPPKGLLLFGPPGTGKTMLGRAIASNIKATFFNISASSLTSKWIGEGEKLVKALFTVAGCMQPSVVFMDEIDSLLSARKGEGEHEASRRLKTELLVQIEGCDPSSAERRLLLVGATNRPEELDEAARRRMPKQLYIPLPGADARRAMVRMYLEGGVSHALSDGDVEKVVQHTEGYSGADMKFMLQEALQGPVREAIKGAASEEAVAALQEADLRPVHLRDVKKATKAQKASVQIEEVKRYEEYNRKHGASYTSADEGEGSSDDDDGW